MAGDMDNDQVAAVAPVMPEYEWAAIRTRRDQLLRATDYTQLPDFPATDEQVGAARAYRQALRDIPESGDEPGSVVWPEIPAFLK